LSASMATVASRCKSKKLSHFEARLLTGFFVSAATLLGFSPT